MIREPRPIRCDPRRISGRRQMIFANDTSGANPPPPENFDSCFGTTYAGAQRYNRSFFSKKTEGSRRVLAQAQWQGVEGRSYPVPYPVSSISRSIARERTQENTPYTEDRYASVWPRHCRAGQTSELHRAMFSSNRALT